jgi:hypothetical protein
MEKTESFDFMYTLPHIENNVIGDRGCKYLSRTAIENIQTLNVGTI